VTAHFRGYALFNSLLLCHPSPCHPTTALLFITRHLIIVWSRYFITTIAQPRPFLCYLAIPWLYLTAPSVLNDRRVVALPFAGSLIQLPLSSMTVIILKFFFLFMNPCLLATCLCLQFSSDENFKPYRYEKYYTRNGIFVHTFNGTLWYHIGANFKSIYKRSSFGNPSEKELKRDKFSFHILSRSLTCILWFPI
jgi:hypothetical protein